MFLLLYIFEILFFHDDREMVYQTGDEDVDRLADGRDG